MTAHLGALSCLALTEREKLDEKHKMHASIFYMPSFHVIAQYEIKPSKYWALSMSVTGLGKLKHVSNRGGNRTYDLWNASTMLCPLTQSDRCEYGTQFCNITPFEPTWVTWPRSSVGSHCASVLKVVGSNIVKFIQGWFIHDPRSALLGPRDPDFVVDEEYPRVAIANFRRTISCDRVALVPRGLPWHLSL